MSPNLIRAQNPSITEHFPLQQDFSVSFAFGQLFFVDIPVDSIVARNDA